jgi:hypothetical protein
MRSRRGLFWRHGSVSAGEIYTDITPAVSGSAMADGVDAGLLKSGFFGVLFKLKKLRKKNIFFAGPICFQQPCLLNLK